MSKQLLLNFNQDGSLSQSQSTGSAIRQGDSNGEVTLVATFQNRRNDAYVAKLHFERPDGKKQRNIVMMPSASQSNQFDYSFLSGWFFAVAGTAKVTVTITDSNGAVSAQGSYSFAVEPTQVDVVDSTITYDEAAELEGLIANSIKRAKTVTLGQNVGVAGFYAACLSYLDDFEDSAILDGDRFVGSTTNPQLNGSTQYFGEFVDDDKMLVIAKKRTRPTPVTTNISHSVYVVSGDAQNPVVTEMVNSNTLESLFDGTSAKKAISDQNGNVIDLTYATKAEIEAKADLVEGKVPASQLPSYVDDAVEGYFFNGAFYSDASHTELIAGERSKIYVDLDTNLTYRWTGSAYVRVNEAVSNVGYIEIDDENEDENGALTSAQVAEANKDVCFIKYTNAEGTVMFVSYYFGGTERYFWSLMTNTLEIGEPDGSPWAYRFRQARIILWDIDDPTSATWQFNEEDDVHVTHEPEETSMDLITSGGVYDAVSALDSKISKNAEDIAALTEALIKKDLYETQEATFQGMTAVPAGALVKAYLDGFKGNSAVVNQVLGSSIPDWVSTGGLTLTTQTTTFTLNGTTTSQITNSGWGMGDCVKGHTYFYSIKLISGSVDASNKTTTLTASGYVLRPRLAGYQYDEAMPTSAGQSFELVETASGSEAKLAASFDAGVVFTNAVFQVMLIDLTIVPLTTAEMADVPTAKAALKHKDMDVEEYIPFNIGTLTDSKPTKLISYPYNLFDGQLAVGSIGPNGQELASTDAIRTINFIKVFGGREYKLEFSDAGGNTFGTYFIAEYDKDKNFIVRNAIYSQPIIRTLQSNTRFVRLAAYSTQAVTTAGIKICFHLASANLGYKPYVAPIEYDLTMPWLKSAGSVQDESKAGGEKVGVGDLATMKNSGWSSYGGYLIPFVYAGTKSASEKPNLTCDKYQVVNATYANSSYTDNLPDKSITVIANGDYLYVKDSSLGSIADLTGTLHYPLATPTDFSDPISYPEIFDVQEGGSIEVVGEGCDATTKVYFYVEA